VRTREKSYLLEDSLTQLEQAYPNLFVRIHRNALVARAAISGFEKQRMAEGEEAGEAAWVVLLKGIPETLVVSRRHQHLIKAT
jgi:two-component system, LytTR family, response regulator AlgR